MSQERREGRVIPRQERIVQLQQLGLAGGLQTMEPLLALCLRLNGEPYTLDDHYTFSPLYNVRMPSKTIYKTGRQVAKTTNGAAHTVMLSACIPGFRTLCVTPLYEQIRRFSSNYVRPFIDSSPIRSLWSGTSTDNSVLQKSFKNGSMILFSFALLDTTRIRGASCSRVYVDELQSMDKDHLPIIYEAMSHSPWGNIVFLTGTPLTLDNTMEVEWQNSSMAEWVIKCRHAGCGHWNIPSIAYDLDAMIGPVHDWISEKYPGVVCSKCRKPLYPRDGRWLHFHRERRHRYAGYHIPQIIMPIHFSKKQKWAELVAKQSGWGNTSRAQFCNEVLGESVDVGQKVITETELKRACQLPWKNDVRYPSSQIRHRLPHYQLRVMGVDWGGGGVEGVSFTAIAVLGMRSDGHFDVLWGKKLVLSQEHLREAMEIAHWMQLFRCDILAHDYTGAGTVRETVLVQAGLPLERVMPFHLLRTARQSLIRYVPPTPIHNRGHYVLDKARSLLYTVQAIKLGLTTFFQWDDQGEENRGLIYDFLALVEQKEESRLAGDIYSITAPTLSDDFAQAVNFAHHAGWHTTRNYPNFAQAADRMNLSLRQRRLAGDEEFGWSREDAR